jgi:molybdopterin-synthase adenylyltransferase
MADLNEEQLQRYSRHILLAGIGIEGQVRLLESKVLIIGVGGLGSPAALYLAASGVGILGIADADEVDRTNLQRQILHFTPDIGRPKVESAAEKLRALNPGVTVNTHHAFINSENILNIIKDYDFIIDATDNFAAKFLINDACVLGKKPFSHGGILRFSGQTMTVVPGQSACYRCVFPVPPPKNAVPSCSQAGVLGGVAGMLGTIQSVEAVKFLTGAGDTLADSLLTFDARGMDFRKIKIRRNLACPVCGDHPSITRLVNEEQPACDLKAAPARLAIQKPVLDAIVEHAQSGRPYEACGYLAKKEDEVVRFFPLKNADESAEHFSFDPAEQFAVVRTIRNEGLSPAAVFHSHPNTPARMSQEDIRLARDPDISYVIVSLAGAEPVIKAFRVRNGTVTPQDVEVRGE